MASLFSDSTRRRMIAMIVLPSALLCVLIAATPAGAVLSPGPTVTGLADGAATTSSVNSFSFEYVTSGAPSFSCSLDGAVAAPCVSPYTTPSLSEGEHTFAVTGMVMTMTWQCIPMEPTPFCGMMPLMESTETVTRRFVIDRTAPEVSITSGPKQLSVSKLRSASFAFAANEAVSGFTCALDQAAAAACASPLTLSKLSPGLHALTIATADAAGNAGSVTRRFAVNSASSTTTFADANTAKTCTLTARKKRGKVLRDARGKIRYKRVCKTTRF